MESEKNDRQVEVKDSEMAALTVERFQAPAQHDPLYTLNGVYCSTFLGASLSAQKEWQDKVLDDRNLKLIFTMHPGTKVRENPSFPMRTIGSVEFQAKDDALSLENVKFINRVLARGTEENFEHIPCFFSILVRKDSLKGSQVPIRACHYISLHDSEILSALKQLAKAYNSYEHTIIEKVVKWVMEDVSISEREFIVTLSLPFKEKKNGATLINVPARGAVRRSVKIRR